MSNLKVIYPDFTLKVTAAPTGATGRSASNLYYGSRQKTFKAASNATLSRFDFDLGSAIKPEYLLIDGANFLRKNDSAAVSVSVTGSASPSFTSPETYTATFNLADLVGTESSIYFRTLTYTTAFRYYRIDITTTASFKHEFRKLYFGRFFDLGLDPAAPLSQFLITGESERRARAQWTIKYIGVTDALLASFNTTILRNRDLFPIYIYTPSNQAFLKESTELVFCKVLEATSKKIMVNCNELSLTLHEGI